MSAKKQEVVVTGVKRRVGMGIISVHRETGGRGERIEPLLLKNK